MLTECYLQIVGTYLAGTVPATVRMAAPNAALAVAFVEDTQAQSMLPELVPTPANAVWVVPTSIEGMKAIVLPVVNCEIPPAVPLPL